MSKEEALLGIEEPTTEQILAVATHSSDNSKKKQIAESESVGVLPVMTKEDLRLRLTELYDASIERILELQNLGIDVQAFVKMIEKRGATSDSEFRSELRGIEALIQRQGYSIEQVNMALKEQIEPRLFGPFIEHQERLKAAELTSIDLMTHAQRKEHFFQMLAEVERKGEVSSSSLVLRSKAMNEVLEHDVAAYSPVGQSLASQGSGLRTISANMNSVQNGYGEFVWIFLPEKILANGASFTALFPLDRGGLHDGNYEVGISSAADHIFEELLLAGDSNMAALETRKAISGGIEQGVPLDNSTAFCLVPYHEYGEVVLRIQGMQISAEDRKKLLRKVIPYSPQDSLANDMVAFLHNHPEDFLALAQNQDPETEMQDLFRQEEKIGPGWFRSREGGVGYEKRVIPEVSLGDIEAAYIAMHLALEERFFEFSNLSQGEQFLLVRKVAYKQAGSERLSEELMIAILESFFQNANDSTDSLQSENRQLLKNLFPYVDESKQVRNLLFD